MHQPIASFIVRVNLGNKKQRDVSKPRAVINYQDINHPGHSPTLPPQKKNGSQVMGWVLLGSACRGRQKWKHHTPGLVLLSTPQRPIHPWPWVGGMLSRQARQSLGLRVSYHVTHNIAPVPYVVATPASHVQFQFPITRAASRVRKGGWKVAFYG